MGSLQLHKAPALPLFVLFIHKDLHKVCNTSSTAVSTFSDRTLAKSAPLDVHHLSQYINIKAERNIQRLRKLLDGTMRMYEFIEIDKSLEERYRQEVHRQPEEAADDITDLLISKSVQGMDDPF
jgi:hypothetical protein